VEIVLRSWGMAYERVGDIIEIIVCMVAHDYNPNTRKAEAGGL
jgi:hypothetical protein